MFYPNDRPVIKASALCETTGQTDDRPQLYLPYCIRILRAYLYDQGPGAGSGIAEACLTFLNFFNIPT